MAKLGYNPKTKEYIVSELGKIVDSDPNLEEIASRQGFFNVIDDEEEAPTQEETEEAD